MRNSLILLLVLAICSVACADSQLVLARVAAAQPEENPLPPSTMITEREYLEAEISHERQERIAASLEMHAQTAIAKEEVDRRLEEMNHLRAQIETERGMFFGVKEQAEYAHAQDDKLASITKLVYTGVGGVLALQALSVAGVGFWAVNRKRAR